MKVEVLQRKVESMGERRAMASAIADKLVKGALCGEVMQRFEKLEGASFYNYESKRAFYI